MKLAFCLFKYFPYGGLQRDFIRIARACVARGHQVHVYTMAWQGARELGLTVHILPPQGWQNHTRNQNFADRVKRQLAIEQYDVVLGFNKMPHLDIYYAADVCYQSRVHHQRSWFYRLLPRYRQQVKLEESVFARGKATHILTISPMQQPEFISHYQTETERFHLLPPGIAKDRLPPINARDIREIMRMTFQIKSEEILLLMVGSGFKTKGVDRALRALAALPADLKSRSRLLIIGEGNPRSFIQLAKQLSIVDQVQFLGARSNVPEFLLAADFLIHTAYHESAGAVILEAMVSGLPVLTSAACGNAHYVKNANAGIVLDLPFQQAACNAALEKMILADEKVHWQQNALDFAKNEDIYTLPNKVADFIETFSELSTVKAGSQALDSKQTVKDQYASVSNEVTSKNHGNHLYLHPDIKQYFSAEIPLFNQMMDLQGTPFRHQEGRLTQRVTLGEKTYFIKQHVGVGWKEIFKNICQAKWPILGAKNEWKALYQLHALGINAPAVLAHGQQGLNPATLKSFILMEDLTPTLSLEDLCKTWLTVPPTYKFKQTLITEVARIARVLHQNGMNHRDFYICHFLLDPFQKIGAEFPKLYLIDLHRAQIRRSTPKRWLIKDLAGLYFSSKEIGLTQHDLYRFMKIYFAQSLREVLGTNKVFWEKVRSRGEQLYRDHT